MNKGNYEIILEVINLESGQQVGIRKAFSLKAAKSEIDRLGGMIKYYDRNNFGECKQCQKVKHVEELSQTDNLELEGLYFCQDCLEGLMSGLIKLKKEF